MYRNFSENEKIALIGIIERVVYADNEFKQQEKKLIDSYLKENGIIDIEHLKNLYYKKYVSDKKFKKLLRYVSQEHYRKFIDIILRISVSDKDINAEELQIIDFLCKTWNVKRGILMDHH